MNKLGIVTGVGVGGVLAEMGLYEFGGRVAGEWYESSHIDNAEKQLRCADFILKLDSGPLSRDCDVEKLVKPYAKPSTIERTDDWATREDKVLERKEVETKDTEFGRTDAILADAKSNLAHVLEGRNEAEGDGGWAAVIGVNGLILVAGSVIAIRRHRANLRARGHEYSPGLMKRGLRHLGLTIPKQTAASSLERVEERDEVSV